MWPWNRKQVIISSFDLNKICTVRPTQAPAMGIATFLFDLTLLYHDGTTDQPNRSWLPHSGWTAEELDRFANQRRARRAGQNTPDKIA